MFIKILPVEGTLLVNEEQQKTYEECLHEIIVSKYGNTFAFAKKRFFVTLNSLITEVCL